MKQHVDMQQEKGKRTIGKDKIAKTKERIAKRKTEVKLLVLAETIKN